MPRKAIYKDANERVKASVDRLYDSGGMRKTFRMNKTTVKALSELVVSMDLKTEKDVVETLIMERWTAQNKGPAR